jgi:hypothetical protein
VRNHSKYDLVYAGLFSGLSLATKLPAALVTFPLLIASMIVFRNQKKGKRRDGIYIFIISFVVFGMTTITVEPGYINRFINIENTIDKLYGQGKKQESDTHHFAKPIDSNKANLYLFYLKVIKKDMGFALFAALLLSLTYFVVKKEKIEFIILSFIVPYYIAITSPTGIMYFDRYTMPIILLSTIVAARGINNAIIDVEKKFFGNCPVHKKCIAIVAVTVILSPTFSNAINFPTILRSSNPRIEAKKWIHANIPSNTEILMEGSDEHRSQLLVQIEPLHQDIASKIEAQKDIDQGKVRYWQLRQNYLSSLNVPRYKLKLIPVDHLWMNYEELLTSDIQYN